MIVSDTETADRTCDSSERINLMMIDESTKKTLSNIPLLQTKAGPRDKEIWVQRLKEEYQALIKVNFISNIVIHHMFIWNS